MNYNLEKFANETLYILETQGNIMSIFNKAYKITKGAYGPRICLFSGWSDDIENLIKKKKILELELNYAKGWPRGSELSFLRNVKQLRGLELLDYVVSDINVINELVELRSLKINSACNNLIDFNSFPNIEDISLEWYPNAESIFNCVTLKRVFINCCNIKDLSVFKKLVNLKYLSLKSPKIESVGIIPSLKNLEFLALGNAKILKSLHGLEVLENLKELEIKKCRNVSNIEPLKYLKNLQRLLICDCGNIDSLKPLETLSELREIYFYESTNIVDGDLTVIKRLPKIKDTSFQDRKHYNLKFYDFNPKEAMAKEKLLKKYGNII